MSYVYVVDTEKRPLNPIHPGEARRLLTAGKAAVWRCYPFTLILKEARPHAPVAPLRLKFDPGSKTTGVAITNDAKGHVVAALEITHHGQQIRDSLATRRAIRHSRRARHTRYRPARFDNRHRPDGWLPPSLTSRVQNILTWTARLRKLCPITAISMELVRFDTQLMQNPEISRIEYQQGELAGYETREYLLEKWARTCAYCGAANTPLQIEHIIPRARGGSNRMSNLTLACEPCNKMKGTQTAAEFGHPAVQAKAKQPLQDAAAVNTTRWMLYERLRATGLSIETGSGGRTKWNRSQRALPKTHWLDAACVGASTPARLSRVGVVPLHITAVGHGTRQMCGTNRAGFPIRHRTRQKRFFGFQTGDITCALVPAGFKTAGKHVGRVLVRAVGSFDLTTHIGRIQGISYRYCRSIHRSDGYSYSHI